MKTRMNFKDEFYQKLKLLVLPIAIQNFMLALVSATDAIMLGWIDQTSLSAVSLAGQVQFVLSLFISGIAAGAGIMADITPSLGSECMTLVKDTSLAHVIGVMEIYVVATNQMARSRGMIYLVVAGIFYLIMNAIVSKVFSVIEKRMNYYR